MTENQIAAQLLAKPIWQMTGEEFLKLNALSRPEQPAQAAGTPIALACGLDELGEKIGCCRTTIYQMRKHGVLDDAVVSNIGRKIIFNIEKARELANSYQNEQREKRRSNM